SIRWRPDLVAVRIDRAGGRRGRFVGPSALRQPGAGMRDVSLFPGRDLGGVSLNAGRQLLRRRLALLDDAPVELGGLSFRHLPRNLFPPLLKGGIDLVTILLLTMTASGSNMSVRISIYIFRG